MTQDGGDSLWTGDNAPRPERRADRYAKRRVDRRSARARHAQEPGPGQRPKRKPETPRKRSIAVVVLVMAVVVTLIVGLELTDSSSVGDTTPFSLLPLDKSAITATSAAGAASTSTTAPISSTTSATTP